MAMTLTPAKRPAVIDLTIEGMSCAGCVSRVEKALSAVPGVSGATVNLATRHATVTLDDKKLPPSALTEAVGRLGYSATARDPGAAAKTAPDAGDLVAEREIRGLRRDVGLAMAGAAPLFVVEMTGHLWPAVHHQVSAVHAWPFVSLALASFVLFVPGLRLLRSGVANLLRLAPEMNALVTLGAGAAYTYSALVTLVPDIFPEDGRRLYFEAAAMIVALVLLGRLLEAQARGRAGAAIRSLMKLQPPRARVVRGETEVEIAVGDVVTGDILAVRPGERMAVDGVVVGGASYADESMLTGEAAPVAKNVGDAITGGTLNTTGALRFRAEKVGADTALAQIVRMVEEAQDGKLPVQALVDRVTGWFVPAVMVVAGVTFIAWMLSPSGSGLADALVHAVAVLIVACPCAMGLATPTSIMVGSGRAAELGLLFRRGAALQALSDVRVVAFDKTGTLTEGRPRLTDLIAAEGASEVLALAAAAEAQAEHPVGRAIVEAAMAEGDAPLTADSFVATPGAGVAARVAGRDVLVGSAGHLAAYGVAAEPLIGALDRLASEAKTAVLVAIDGRAAGVIAVADPLKASAVEGLARLRGLGLKVAMVSGDNAHTANAVARGLELDEVRAEVSPADKVAVLTQLRARFGSIAFVGDGVNDAPALAHADVGVAMGRGSDVAIDSAEVVLMRDDVRAVAAAVELSRAVLANIRQNLAWAFGYNVLLIPVAAGALQPLFGMTLSPVLAAGAMAVSSVSVVSNALRLRGFRPALGDAT